MMGLFAPFGSVISVRVRVRTKGDGVAKSSWALLTFESDAEAAAAVAGAGEIDHGAVCSDGAAWLVQPVDDEKSSKATGAMGGVRAETTAHELEERLRLAVSNPHLILTQSAPSLRLALN